MIRPASTVPRPRAFSKRSWSASTLNQPSTYDRRIIFESPILSVGLFRLSPEDPNFHGAGAISSHLIVFPRTSVYITHWGKDPIATDPNCVMFYNQGQPYQREKISERGDLCEFFPFAPEIIEDAIRPFDPSVCDRPQHPFQFTHGPSLPSAYLLQRMVVEHILSSQEVDRLFVEETMMQVLCSVVARAFQVQASSADRSSRMTRKHQVELVRLTKTVLAKEFSKGLSLEEIASRVHCSPYHLSRIFRLHTGETIHRYLNQLRLRTSLEYVTGSETDLTDLALRLGFSSHSHFTQSFRRCFGEPPSSLRKRSFARSLSKVSRILIA